MRHGVQIKCAGADFFSKIRDVLRLAEAYAQSLQPEDARRQNGFGVHLTQCVLHPLPDGGLRLGGDLLADDVVDNGRKQVRIHRAVDVTDAVDDLAQPLVLPPQIGQLFFSVRKIHICHLPVCSLCCAVCRRFLLQAYHKRGAIVKAAPHNKSCLQLLLFHYAVLPKIKCCFYSPSFLLERDGVYYTVN